MAIEGWYYLHTNGSLIYKKELGGTVADIRDSDFAIGLWPFDPIDREGAWRIVIECLASGVPLARIQELALRWGCDDKDADIYASRVGCNLFMDGDQWVATGGDFINLQESVAGFGPSKLEAMANLAKHMDYKPSKMWGATFHDLLGQHRDVAQEG